MILRGTVETPKRTGFVCPRFTGRGCPENLLGDEGLGIQIAMWTLTGGRLGVAAGSLGAIEDCITEAVN